MLLTTLFVLAGSIAVMLLDSDFTWIVLINWLMDWLTGDK